jgi:hypothetical protein
MLMTVNHNSKYMYLILIKYLYVYTTWYRNQVIHKKYKKTLHISSHTLSIYLSIYLIYGPTGLVGLDRFFGSFIYTQSIVLLGRRISLLQGRYLHTKQHKHRINAHTNLCLEWDSNPRPQCSIGRRPRGHCDRPSHTLLTLIMLPWKWSRLLLGKPLLINRYRTRMKSVRPFDKIDISS